MSKMNKNKGFDVRKFNIQNDDFDENNNNVKTNNNNVKQEKTDKGKRIQALYLKMKKQSKLQLIIKLKTSRLMKIWIQCHNLNIILTKLMKL